MVISFANIYIPIHAVVEPISNANKNLSIYIYPDYFFGCGIQYTNSFKDLSVTKLSYLSFYSLLKSNNCLMMYHCHLVLSKKPWLKIPPWNLSDFDILIELNTQNAFFHKKLLLTFCFVILSPIFSLLCSLRHCGY